MLIGFLGCPSSGKTTTAALVFAKLKTDGIVTEFISEQARYYIAQKRVRENRLPTEKIILNNYDQLGIATNQLSHEKTFQLACGEDVIIVSDGSVYNSLLYMSDDFLNDFDVKKLIESSSYDLLFHCQPIHFSYDNDPNRVHDSKQSELIDKRIPTIKSLFPSIPKYYTLFGIPTERSNSVVDIIYKRIMEC